MQKKSYRKRERSGKSGESGARGADKEDEQIKNFKQFFRKYDRDCLSHFIPCMHRPYLNGSSKVLLYFHANAEDVILAHELLENVKNFLKIHVVAVEYPGYGLFQK